MRRKLKVAPTWRADGINCTFVDDLEEEEEEESEKTSVTKVARIQSTLSMEKRTMSILRVSGTPEMGENQPCQAGSLTLSSSPTSSDAMTMAKRSLVQKLFESSGKLGKRLFLLSLSCGGLWLLEKRGRDRLCW